MRHVAVLSLSVLVALNCASKTTANVDADNGDASGADGGLEYAVVACTDGEIGTCRRTIGCSFETVNHAVKASSAGDGVYLPACTAT